LTGFGKAGNEAIMLDLDRKWPLGIARISFWTYAACLLAILVGLLLVDGPVAAWAASSLASTHPFFAIITIPGDSAWTLLPALVIGLMAFALGLVLRKGPRKVRAMNVAAIAAFVFVGVAGPGLIANLIKRLIGRARPVHFDELGAFVFRPFQGWDFQSFPSGDATTVFAGASIVLFFFPRLGQVAVAGAALVGFARIALGMHFASDVFGGFLLGTFGAYAVRNFCLNRSWLFKQTADGRVVPDLRQDQDRAA
jgi:membrane-associated phospholipid phosphatase